MKLKEIEIIIKKELTGYFEDYCNNCPYIDEELVEIEYIGKISQKELYKCKNKDICNRIYNLGEK